MKEYRDTRYPVRRYERGSTQELPPGHGGIAVLAWYPVPHDRRHLSVPLVSVDGSPAFESWGRALIVVPAGERLVEARHNDAQITRTVAVTAGKIIELDYVPAEGISRSRLGPSPQLPVMFLAQVVLLLAVSVGGLIALVSTLVTWWSRDDGGYLVVAALEALVAVGAALGARMTLRQRTKPRETR